MTQSPSSRYKSYLDIMTAVSTGAAKLNMLKDTYVYRYLAKSAYPVQHTRLLRAVWYHYASLDDARTDIAQLLEHGLITSERRTAVGARKPATYYSVASVASGALDAQQETSSK